MLLQCRLPGLLLNEIHNCKIGETGISMAWFFNLYSTCEVIRYHVRLRLCSGLQLLTEMDGFDSETGVMVIAATNRPEVLDAALTRPGRISRRVNVEAPDFAGRQQVLAVHMRSTPVEGDAATLRAVVASLTPGFVGADLANVVNEAALLAARQGILRAFLPDLRVLKSDSFRIGTKVSAARISYLHKAYPGT
jgi:hypothetical protein